MTTTLVAFALSVFTGFFAVMNPIATIPIFLGLVEGKNKASKKRIAKKASFTAFFIVLTFVLLGKLIFELFGITIPAFKITGGILLFYIGFEMLLSQKSKVHSRELVDEDDGVAISPLGIPILAGPGTIVTAMSHATDANFLQIVIIIAVFALMVYLTYISCTVGDMIVQRIGANIIAVIGKIMGLILAIMGTGMIINGLHLAFEKS